MSVATLTRQNPTTLAKRLSKEAADDATKVGADGTTAAATNTAVTDGAAKAECAPTADALKHGVPAETPLAANPAAAADARKTIAAADAQRQAALSAPAADAGVRPRTGIAKEPQADVATNLKNVEAGADAATPAAEAAPGADATAPAADAAPYIGPTLRRGKRGPDVDTLQAALKDNGFDIKQDGIFGPETQRAVRGFQEKMDIRVDGVVGPETYGKLGIKADAVPAPTPGAAGDLSGAFTPNETAIAAAGRTGPGRNLNAQVEKHAEMYKRASELTGVPASVIAAIHGQESGFGTYRPSINGPESGFGLDPRYVSNSYGNAQLQKHGLGTWQRGQNTETGRMQSAVIAAEHFKRNAAQAGVTVGPNMSQRDILLASTSYIAGAGSRITARAKTSGKSFVFDPSDSNPHPYHPGGTSIGARGQTIRVPPGRKDGLLRWDVMIPMIERKLNSGAPTS